MVYTVIVRIKDKLIAASITVQTQLINLLLQLDSGLCFIIYFFQTQSCFLFKCLITFNEVSTLYLNFLQYWWAHTIACCWYFLEHSRKLNYFYAGHMWRRTNWQNNYKNEKTKVGKKKQIDSSDMQEQDIPSLRTVLLQWLSEDSTGVGAC